MPLSPYPPLGPNPDDLQQQGLQQQGLQQQISSTKQYYEYRPSSEPPPISAQPRPEKWQSTERSRAVEAAAQRAEPQLPRA